MNPAIIVLMALFFSSVMLSIIFFTLWRMLDRPRHALLWAISYGLSSAHWILNAAGVIFFNGKGVYFVLATITPLVQVSLTLAGYRYRSGVAEGWPRLAAAAAIVLAAVTVVTLVHPHQGLKFALIPFYSSVVLLLCVNAIRRREAALTAAERAVIVVLGLFALYEALLTVIALGIGSGPNELAYERYRVALLLGLPSLFIGSGLFGVFLLASDLADRMRRLAASDPLTGVLNRRGFEEAAGRAFANARRHEQPLVLAIADIDHFKSVNDRFGHAAGDRALCRLAQHLEGGVRRGDLVGRLGGEEFAILLVNASGATGAEVIERLRERIERLSADAQLAARITSSFGLTELAATDRDVETMLLRADRALYRSKLEGRNRLTVAEAEDAEVDVLMP